MKRELAQASDDSRRLRDKLSRLERENRQLEVVVSRLGGRDARRLKAQVKILLQCRPRLQILVVPLRQAASWWVVSGVSCGRRKTSTRKRSSSLPRWNGRLTRAVAVRMPIYDTKVDFKVKNVIFIGKPTTCWAAVCDAWRASSRR